MKKRPTRQNVASTGGSALGAAIALLIAWAFSLDPDENQVWALTTVCTVVTGYFAALLDQHM